MSELKRELQKSFKRTFQNSWTGGQYSLFRIFLGLNLLWQYGHLVFEGKELFSNQGMIPQAANQTLFFFIPNIVAILDMPFLIIVFAILGIIASGSFIVGRYDRFAAVFLWYLGACLFGRNPLIGQTSLAFVGWILLAHAFLPRAPFGSWEFKRQENFHWRFPWEIQAAAWIILGVYIATLGVRHFLDPIWLNGFALVHFASSAFVSLLIPAKLIANTPPELLRLASWSVIGFQVWFLPLIFLPAIRPLFWTILFIVHLLTFVFLPFSLFNLGFLFFLWFCFNPDWLKPRFIENRVRIFYDGHCGLCHGFVRFVLAEDFDGFFSFAPLQGATFEKTISKEKRQNLPDSIVVLDGEGNPLARSEAVIYSLKHLGGIWAVCSWLLWLIPQPIRNLGYDFIARVRHQLFKRPDDLCPLMPSEFQKRFEA